MGYHIHDVALVEDGLSVYHLLGASTFGAMYLGNHEVAVQDMAHLLDGVSEDHLVGNLHGECVEGHRLQVSESTLGLCFLLALVDAEGIAQDDEGEDDTEHTHRVGDGITGSYGRSVDVAQVTVSLLGSTQSRGVGDGTRQDTSHRGDGGIGERVDDEGGDDAQCYHDDAEQVEALSTVLERGEEARTYLQANGIDEEYQAELLEEVEQVLVEVEREMAEDKTDK